MLVPPDWDFKNPDYATVYKLRAAAIGRMRANPKQIPLLKAYYKANPAQFISDWGCTSDPRLVERALPAIIPFILFPKQIEWVNWVIERWKSQEPGITEKSRDVGMSWLSVSLACTLCLFNDGMQIGFGSRKAEYVDLAGSPKSLFHRAREFMSYIPKEFRGGWDRNTDAPYMRMRFPESGSALSGESGDNIGRGDRASIYFVDESAFLERPQMIEASLSATTNCRIDISSANGMGNPFAQKRHSGRIKLITVHWRDDPRKDDAWYAKQCAELDPVTVASELDISYTASVERVLIPSAWVQAAIDAHKTLNIYPTGARTGALDVADEGSDKNAFCGAHGILVEVMEEWTGKGSDPFATTVKAFDLCDQHKFAAFKYDSDGIGANVRGDARVINEERRKAGKSLIQVEAFRGSATPFNPDAQDVPGRLNKDYFLNCKAQAWWRLRMRFQKTYQAVNDGAQVRPDEIISLSSSLPLLARLCNELSQPTYDLTTVGKLFVDKAPEGTRSPNLADAVMMQFSKAARSPIVITSDMLARA